MKINTSVVLFDVETTGITGDVRIVKIYARKMNPYGVSEELEILIDPEIPIPAEASAIHGIFDRDVMGCPKFREVADKIFNFMKGAHQAGFNIKKFDLPILDKHLNSCGFPSLIQPDILILDGLQIFHHFNKRDLAAAAKRYTSIDTFNAHDPKEDVEVTWEVLKGQLAEHAELGGSIEEAVSYMSGFDRTLDIEAKFAKNEHGVVIFNFGKHKGQAVFHHVDYLEWMLMKMGMSPNSKDVAQELYKNYIIQRLADLGLEDDIPRAFSLHVALIYGTNQGDFHVRQIQGRTNVTDVLHPNDVLVLPDKIFVDLVHDALNQMYSHSGGIEAAQAFYLDMLNSGY